MYKTSYRNDTCADSVKQKCFSTRKESYNAKQSKHFLKIRMVCIIRVTEKYFLLKDAVRSLEHILNKTGEIPYVVL